MERRYLPPPVPHLIETTDEAIHNKAGVIDLLAASKMDCRTSFELAMAGLPLLNSTYPFILNRVGNAMEEIVALPFASGRISPWAAPRLLVRARQSV